MKREYVSYSILNGIEFPVMGGGMGGGYIHSPLSIMAMPEQFNSAVRESQAGIVAKIKQDIDNGAKLNSIEYTANIVNRAPTSGGDLQGAYLELTAKVEFD